jgi:hypothetical protein
MMMQRQDFTLKKVRDTDAAYGPVVLCITCTKFKSFKYRGEHGGLGMVRSIQRQ